MYLNDVYFGNGAYGIESAAETYFAKAHPGCAPHCASKLLPWEAAMLAGHHRLDNLVAVMDNNGMQIDGRCCDVVSLGARIAAMPPGRQARLSVLRDGRVQSIPVQIGRRPTGS